MVGRPLARTVVCLVIATALLWNGPWSHRPALVVAASPADSACPLTASANPSAIQQGGSVALLYTSAPGATIQTVIQDSGAYPASAALIAGGGGGVATAVAGTPVAGGYQFTFAAGSDGTALLSFPIPSTAPLEQVGVQITAVCNLQQTSQALSFGVAAAQLIPFTNQLFLALHAVLIRSVELPPNAGSVVHNLITVSTNANALVTLSAVVSSTRPGSLGTAVDGGTAYASGTVLYTAVTTSDTGGTALFNLPLSSALLTPGRGAVVKVIVTCATGSSATVYRTSFPVREIPLRLVIQAKESTLGNKRQVFLLGSLFGWHEHAPRAGAGRKGRAHHRHLRRCVPRRAAYCCQSAPDRRSGRQGDVTFAVPNSIAPPRGSHADGTLTVQSTFRGATLTRNLTVTFGRR